MTGLPSLTFERYDAEAASSARAAVETVYRDAYFEAVASDDPFNGPEPFMRRFDAYTRPGRGFDLVIAYADTEPVAQAWGWPLGRAAAWWHGLESEPEPGFTDEDGKRTFALSEIMVRRPWTGRGVAHALHDELLGGRNEKRATLLVEPGNDVAYRAYVAWGWRKVARLRPAWPDAPLYDVLILPLPVGTV
jgi:GNAT superfamily N-acetyltransferase